MKEPQKTEKSGRVLVVDDNEDVLLAARLLLRQHVQTVKTETDPSSIPWILDSDDIDVVLLDMNFTRDVSSGQEGFDWLARIKEIDPSIVVVLMTAYGDVDIAVRAIKAGASDFVLKPWQNEKLWATISMRSQFPLLISCSMSCRNRRVTNHRRNGIIKARIEK